MTRDDATGVVGYYVHHVGSGHRHRAQVLAARLRRDGVAVTGLSSLPRPGDWDGDWVRLPRDDDGDPRDVSAHGHLHWAPLLHDGTRSRAATLSAWLETARPDLLGQLSVHAPSCEPATITLPAKKTLIASRLNLTQEHFSRILHDLQSAGLIAVHGRQIRLLDLRRLRTLPDRVNGGARQDAC